MLHQLILGKKTAFTQASLFKKERSLYTMALGRHSVMEYKLLKNTSMKYNSDQLAFGPTIP